MSHRTAHRNDLSSIFLYLSSPVREEARIEHRPDSATAMLAFTNSSSFIPARSQTFFSRSRCENKATRMSSVVEQKSAGMRLIKQASEGVIDKLGCRTWPKWGCEASKFPWTYSDDEICLVLQGEFTVIPDEGGEEMRMFLSFSQAMRGYCNFRDFEAGRRVLNFYSNKLFVIRRCDAGWQMLMPGI